MIIIETCPNCGQDLFDEIICTNPPIPKKSCLSCGWHWEGEREEIIRMPFGGNSLDVKQDTYLPTTCVLNNIDGSDATITTICFGD